MSSFTNLLFLSLLAVSLVSGAQKFANSTWQELPMLPGLPAPADVYRAPENLKIVFKFDEIHLPNISLAPRAPRAPEKLEVDQKSLKIAGFVAQLFIFLFVFSIVTVDFDPEIYDENVPVLRRAREIQTTPLPARMRVRMVRLVESDC